MDPRAGARLPAPAGAASPTGRAARPVVTPARGDCETDADFLIARQMPNQNHPLTRAYMLGARATSPAAMTEAMRLIRACETGADQLTIDQCKLAAEVLLERKMP
jgi:hypothetical protein